MTGSTESSEGLLTPLAFALSLSAPRAPPLGSAQRALMLGRDPMQQKLLTTFSCFRERQQESDAKCGLLEREIAWKVLRRDFQRQRSNRIKKNHPYLLYQQDRDWITRYLGTSFSIQFWNFVRDNGHFRFILDLLVTLAIPSLALGAPQACLKFLEFSSTSLQQIVYGNHKRHIIDIFTGRSRKPQNVNNSPSRTAPRLLVFIHGGAWGSGRSWMYRLVCHQFSEWTVAVVGYRTYPDAAVEGQVQDLNNAYEALKENFPNHLMYLIGHSSGAHIGLIHVIQQAKQLLKTRKQQNKENLLDIARNRSKYAAYIGLSGPYNVSHHFDYEAARGVEELSPLKPVNGMTRKALVQNSPVSQMQELLLFDEVAPNTIDSEAFLPQSMLLVHGIEDTTVPFTATAETASHIRSFGLVKQVDEMYFAKTGHQDTVFQLMLGGDVLDKVSSWLDTVTENSVKTRGIVTAKSSEVVIKSRL